MAHVNSRHGKKILKILKKCVGGTNLHYLLCLISSTLPQLEQSSLHPQQFSVIASCYGFGDFYPQNCHFGFIWGTNRGI